MGKAQLLDCTLRDGAYIIDKEFGDLTIRGIINGLQKARVDYIEIGFLQNDGFGVGKTVFKNSTDAKRYIPENKGNSEFAVLADYSRYSIENLDQNTGDSIDIVRECFFKHERYHAIEVCKTIKEKGYKVFVQPVDILGYTDAEILELINLVNELEPYCLSIVDTFGSMYEEDLQRVFSIINHNLISTCKIGFHSHNNMQMSNALSQAFLRMSQDKREVIVDSTLSGMGRGAGNTPTELIAQYMFAKLGYQYDMDALLDVIDGYMNNLRTRASWGYSTPYFVAGAYSAHVNNIAYLTEKNSIRSKDIRYILNKIGAVPRKRYDYDLLERTYMEYLRSDIDDTEAMNLLRNTISGKNVVVIVPGKTAADNVEIIQKHIKDNDAIVVTVNFMHDRIKPDYVYVSNVKRFNYWNNTEQFKAVKKILTSNIVSDMNNVPNALIVSFTKLVKCGWEHLDNSTLMLLRLLDILGVKSISLAGFDGYSQKADDNYINPFMELSNVKENPICLNEEISLMLQDYMNTRITKASIHFITESRFAHIMES